MNNISLPKNYGWLKYEQAPKVLVAALSLYGIKEVKGPGNNPVILEWGKELGISVPSDEQAWCGLYLAIVSHLAGYEVVKNPLAARSWLNWGIKASSPMLGDICVFERGEWMGHCGIYIGQDDDYYHILGGNQSDSVSISRVAKSRALGFRRSPFKIGQPINVRKIYLKPTGVITTNEK